MLVYFHKGFLLEGENTCFKRERFWKKPVKFRKNIYLFSSVSGICDISEVESEVDRLIKEDLLKTSGWGEGFSGWRVVPFYRAIEIAKEKGWDIKRIPDDELTIEYISTWKMNKILERLTGEQFARFCKDHGIFYKDGGLNV